jgi:hypothetical protein
LCCGRNGTAPPLPGDTAAPGDVELGAAGVTMAIGGFWNGGSPVPL